MAYTNNEDMNILHLKPLNKMDENLQKCVSLNEKNWTKLHWNVFEW